MEQTLSTPQTLSANTRMNAKLILLVGLAWSNFAFCGEIHDAVQIGDQAKVKVLLKANPDLVSSKDDKGWTPLHYAAKSGHKDVAELLLASNADVNAREEGGDTPLHAAASFDQKDVAELLLAHKAKVNARDKIADTPLHAAALSGSKDVAELLLGT